MAVLPEAMLREVLHRSHDNDLFAALFTCKLINSVLRDARKDVRHPSNAHCVSSLALLDFAFAHGWSWSLCRDDFPMAGADDNAQPMQLAAAGGCLAVFKRAVASCDRFSVFAHRKESKRARRRRKSSSGLRGGLGRHKTAEGIMTAAVSTFSIRLCLSNMGVSARMNSPGMASLRPTFVLFGMPLLLTVYLHPLYPTHSLAMFSSSCTAGCIIHLAVENQLASDIAVNTEYLSSNEVDQEAVLCDASVAMYPGFREAVFRVRAAALAKETRLEEMRARTSGRANAGHLDILKWAYAHGCPLKVGGYAPGTGSTTALTLLSVAKRGGSAEILQWLSDNNCAKTNKEEAEEEDGGDGGDGNEGKE